MRKVSSSINKTFPSVMQHHLFWVVFVTCFTFFNKCETKQPQDEDGIPYIISRLLGNRNQRPIILYLNPKQNDRSIEQLLQNVDQNARSFEESREDERHNFGSHEDLKNLREDAELEEDNNENFLKTARYDERAYLLYHLLRSTIEEEDIDPETVQRLRPAQEYLRSAFIGRCRRLNKCINQCPKPRKNYSCTMQCKEIFDDLDQCNEPKEDPCATSKCGHTMPPSWLL